MRCRLRAANTVSGLATATTRTSRRSRARRLDYPIAHVAYRRAAIHLKAAVARERLACLAGGGLVTHGAVGVRNARVAATVYITNIFDIQVHERWTWRATRCLESETKTLFSVTCLIKHGLLYG